MLIQPFVYAECRILIVMQSVVRLNVVMQSVVAAPIELKGSLPSDIALLSYIALLNTRATLDEGIEAQFWR